MIRAVSWHDGQRWCCALARDGRTRLHLTFIDDCGIRHVSVPRDEERHTQPLLRKGHEYEVDRLVRRFRAIGRERGITEAAKAELKEASTCP